MPYPSDDMMPRLFSPFKSLCALVLVLGCALSPLASALSADDVKPLGGDDFDAKSQAIDKLMRKGISGGKKPKKEVKLVVAKGAHKGVKGRPTGVKGRYTMVDSRMKKEVSFSFDAVLRLTLTPLTASCQETEREGHEKAPIK